MNKYLAAVALSGTLAQPAVAVTFPTLTTIYVGSGVRNTSDPINEGIATAFFCTNASGLTANLRFLVLNFNGNVAGSVTVSTVLHGQTRTITTHGITFLGNDSTDTSQGTIIDQGSIIIEATESGVFCTAAVFDAEGFPPVFSTPLHLVRVNPHPGTVE